MTNIQIFLGIRVKNNINAQKIYGFRQNLQSFCFFLQAVFYIFWKTFSPGTGSDMRDKSSSPRQSPTKLDLFLQISSQVLLETFGFKSDLTCNL